MSNLIDIVILALLAGTVFYAMRLSEQLNILRDSKSELEQLVSNLSINIRRAHEAIQEMQDVATKSGDDLHNLIAKGQDLSSELQIINESSNSVANRLEIGIGGLVKKPHSRKKDTPADDYADTYFDTDDFTNYDETHENDNETIGSQPRERRKVANSRRLTSQSIDNFFIRDREFESKFEDELDGYDDYEDEFQNLSSRAEKQLASAMRRNRKFDA